MRRAAALALVHKPGLVGLFAKVLLSLLLVFEHLQTGLHRSLFTSLGVRILLTVDHRHDGSPMPTSSEDAGALLSLHPNYTVYFDIIDDRGRGVVLVLANPGQRQRKPHSTASFWRCSSERLHQTTSGVARTRTGTVFVQENRRFSARPATGFGAGVSAVALQSYA